MKYKALTQGGKVVDIWEYINRDEWFCRQWVIYIGPELAFVVEADTYNDAIDALVDDGRWNHLIEADEDDDDAYPAGDRGIMISDVNPGNEIGGEKADFVWRTLNTGEFAGFIFEEHRYAERLNLPTAKKIVKGEIQ